MAPERKSIFQYDDYRLFLADYYRAAKAENKKFSFRFFSRIAGFKSTNFLYLVMKGKSKVSRISADRLARAMKLNKEEATFFKNLILFNQSANSLEKQKHSQELMRSLSYQKFFPLSEVQHRYLSRWYYSIVRGMVGLPGFKEDYRWIASKIKPAITEEEAREAIAELEKLGLLSRNSRGRLQQTNANIATSNAVVSSFMAHFHREMMKRASESIDRFQRDKRDLSAITIGVSAGTAQIIRELAEKFRSDIINAASQDQDPGFLISSELLSLPDS